mgnify:CR=1 FL=1
MYLSKDINFLVLNQKNVMKLSEICENSNS